MKIAIAGKLINANIDLGKLKKGLKHIGLTLYKFEDIKEERIPELIGLFKTVVAVDLQGSSRYTRMDLRSKFDKFFKDKSGNSLKKTVKSQVNQAKKKSKTRENRNPKGRASLSSRSKKIGRVKFFDSTKGFGYVYSYDDERDCFIHVSKLNTPGIDKNDIVLFETVNSKRKPGELDAINISNKIPVFIFNKEFHIESFVYPLLNNHLENEISLTEKYENGFAIITAYSRSSRWKASIMPSEIIANSKTIFSKKIIRNLLLNLNEYKSTVEWIITFLQKELKEADFNKIYADVINKFEQKNIFEIYTEIKRDVPFFSSFFEQKKKTLSKISFVLWDIGEIEKLPIPSNQDEAVIWRFEIMSVLNWSILQEVLLKLVEEQGATKQVEESYKYLISQGWEINTKDELETIVNFLERFKSFFPAIAIEETNYQCKSSQFYIELYDKGFIKELSETRSKQYIDELKTDGEKADFIEKQPLDKILFYYSAFPYLSHYKQRHIADKLESTFSGIDFVCFDLESDGQKINEFAWKTKLGIKFETDFNEQDVGISELVKLLNSDTLIIGQNIKKFDLLILANHGALPSNDLIWDTLEVEMLLNPQRFSHGLKAEHDAISDIELTFRLFKNQLSRIITSPKIFSVVKGVLPIKGIDAINKISSNPSWKSLDFEYFEKLSNEFYRPNPTNQNISEETFIQLKEKISEEGNKVIIAPEFLWNTLSHQLDLNFYSDNKNFAFCLSKKKIESTFDDDKYLKTILSRFVESCISKGLQPFLEHLPVAIRLKLTAEQIRLICDNIEADFSRISSKPICIQPTDVEILEQHVNNIQNLKVIIIGRELYNLTSKVQLGQDLDFATIFDRLKNEPIWLQMSGGKSCISLSESDCEKLGITGFPNFIKNIWLEKVGKGKFKVWCNLNFMDCLNDLPLGESYDIPWVNESTIKVNLYIVRPDARMSGYIAEQKRVNPESLYRKIYWVYQFKLFEGIGNSKNPKILIVNDESESEKLSAYARRKGYFIPDTNSSLIRQVELLHTHKHPKKMLITTIQNLDKVISCNYIGALDFIWDSFLLQEKVQMLKDELLANIRSNEEQKEEDFQIGANSEKKDFDSFFLIKKHKPLIDYYYKMLFDNNQDSQLFLCDARFADYYGVERSLNLNAKSVQMWFNDKAYDLEIEVASEFFTSLNENSNVDFNIDEAKEILRQIFLVPEEGGEAYQWYPYQHPCLNEILPAKKDLLISLPTGGGKSLLFQGPALFRSAFSCKLSIVVSPLRALMQDQVDALWSKGFYSNVEFLSGDKSQVEIRDIYRRVSGGEITLLYITPERFRSRSFENCLLTRLDADSGLEYVVFDEAHCISQWGQEFRPDYLNAGRKVAGYSKTFHMRKLLFSATISEQVFGEISVLMPGIGIVEGIEKNYNPVRNHIKMDFKHNVVEDDRLSEIANYIRAGNFNPELSRAIVFVKSRKKVEECALIMSDSLKKVFEIDCDFADKVGAFHAGMDAEDRKDTYERYKSGGIVILFATKAFGMGMDIPNIHFVIHYSPPSTFEDFLQEVGRAGRDEKQRVKAGFNNNDNPIKTLCLTTNNDFSKLKDQLHKSRISWHEVKDIKRVLEGYISKFKPLVADAELPVAVPFNLYSNAKSSLKDDLDNKFRIALHWLEKLKRVKLGYFTITHLEFDAVSLNALIERIKECPDKNCKKVCYAIIDLMPKGTISNEVIQLSIASLRNSSKLSLNNLFTALLKIHNAGILKLIQKVFISPTKIRFNETNYCRNIDEDRKKYPALQVIFDLASKILDSVPSNDSKVFEGEELDYFLKESINEIINFEILPWTINGEQDTQIKEYRKYIKDIFNKRSKHAFTIIRLLGKAKHETKMEKVMDGNRKTRVRQSVFNGYHKKEEWVNKITQVQNDCIELLDYVVPNYIDNNIKMFNWPDIISELKFDGNVQYLSDLLFILSVLGYSKTGSLLPAGIEVYLNSLETIDETDLQSFDKKIFEEFEETRKVRELKLIALEVLAGFQRGALGNDVGALRAKQDTFIKKYFACNSLENLLNLLQDELPANDPMLVKWRGDAIKVEEDRLNDEQKKVYDAEINQHINVMAGPGSGKTHTLTLRVARLVHHVGINPEEILVLAYNRAVVSELKERLGRLFNDLGYGNLAKRIKIFTFHGMAKRYCKDDVNGKPFGEWENILLNQLNDSPGGIMNQLASLKHILVDEFQDINTRRIKLLKKLHNLTESYLFIIGDPNQSIYGYERINEGGSISPWPYYDDFSEIFNPTHFKLYDNHRSYPEILNLAGQILTLPQEHKHLIPRPTRVPDNDFITDYAKIIDLTKDQIKWWDQIAVLINERVGERPYKQIAILFRTNNEVYRGFQKVKRLNLPNTKIRIQGSLPYEFTRIRECHAVILHLKASLGQQIPLDFKQTFCAFITNLIKQNSNWNHFYIRVMHAIVLEYLNEQDESQIFDDLLEFIIELTYKDDGQLYKIYEKHLDKITTSTHETEIVLTTMHKVKGLEFDSVIIPPSLSNLPLGGNDNLTQPELEELLDEEKRLAFVAYTRARYRLVIFKYFREIALANNDSYVVPEKTNARIGIPVQPEIKKLKIGWAAKAFNFNSGVNDYIKNSIKSGDFVFVRNRNVVYNGTHFAVHELLKENTTRPVGELAKSTNIIGDNKTVSGFVVNEVVVWSFEDTRKFDSEKGTKFSKDWCQEAIDKGYIYLVDFAGFGVPGN